MRKHVYQLSWPRPIDPLKPVPRAEAEITINLYEAGELSHTITAGRVHLPVDGLKLDVLEEVDREWDGDRVLYLPARYLSLELAPSLVPSGQMFTITEV